MEKITVVMPAYREKKEQISQAIESILKQTYSDFKYIIVLDDPNNEELKALLQQYAEQDKRITLIVNEVNGGCPYSKDKGIRLADTEYVAIMDGDDIAEPIRLEKQLKKMETEQVDIIAAKVAVIDESGKELYKMDNLPLEHEQIAKKMRVNNCMPHPTWFLKKKVYLALNGYADIQGCEDYDFLIRAILAGYRMGMVDEILLKYRLSTQSISRNNLYKQYLMMRYLQDKYYYHKWSYDKYNDFEKAHYTEKKAKKYAKSSVYFEKALSEKSNRKYVGMLKNLMATVLTSKEYTWKLVKYVMQEL